MKVLQDEDSEVRGNCTYALGVLAAFGGDAICAYLLEEGGVRGGKFLMIYKFLHCIGLSKVY